MADDNLFKTFAERVAPKRETKTAAPVAAALVVNHTGEREPYEAFGSKDKAFRFDVRCASGVAHSLPYTYLLDIGYDRRHYNAIFLTVGGLTVTIKGKALRPIVDALKLHTCEFIQAYDAGEFTAPLDPASPHVQSIEVEVMQGAPRTKDEADKERGAR
jgi:hypothetical protein